MKARKYTKSINLFTAVEVSDGFGGYVVNNSVSYKMWANVTTKRAYLRNENGQNDNILQTVFTVRNRVGMDISVKNNYIVYNGVVYNIDSVSNHDLNNIDLEIYASQRY
jgi:head-tail adaptor